MNSNYYLYIPTGLGVADGVGPVGGATVSQTGTWQHLLLGSVVKVHWEGRGGERAHLVKLYNT